MKLMTKANYVALPPLYSQEKNPDPMVQVKFFDPCSRWTWYAIEGQPDDGNFMMFGLVVGHETELGYFSLNELAKIRNAFGIGIERDRHFRPTPLSVVRAQMETSS